MAPPVFNLDPQAIPENFKWNSDKYHLTYPGFISVDDMMASVLAKSALVLTSAQRPNLDIFRAPPAHIAP